ncbi:MAG: transposase [Planctomycetia bacterium]
MSEKGTQLFFQGSLMLNHWHFVVRPDADHQVSNFFRWLTHTHTMRWHASHHTVGTGHLYQGRFKARPARREMSCVPFLRPPFCVRAVNRRYNRRTRCGDYGFHPRKKGLAEP